MDRDTARPTDLAGAQPPAPAPHPSDATAELVRLSDNPFSLKRREVV